MNIRPQILKRGFTLAEALIATAIILLVFGSVLFAFNVSQKVYRGGEAGAEITQNGRVLLERLTRELRQAREIVTELPASELLATSTLMFEDGHISDSYQYIRYFQDEGALDVQREAIGFYFSGDPLQTLVAYDAVPPSGQTLDKKTLQAPQIVGEFVSQAKFWKDDVIYLGLFLEKRDRSINLRTSISGRNL